MKKSEARKLQPGTVVRVKATGELVTLGPISHTAPYKSSAFAKLGVLGLREQFTFLLQAENNGPCFSHLEVERINEKPVGRKQKGLVQRMLDLIYKKTETVPVGHET